MNIEQERAEFEAWYRLHHGSLDVYGRDASGEYADKQVQGAFNVWQARAALTAQPAASAEPSDDDLFRLYEEGVGFEIKHSRSRIIPLLRALLARYGRQQAESADQVQALREALHAAAEYIGDRSAGSSTFWDLYDAAMAKGGEA